MLGGESKSLKSSLAVLRRRFFFAESISCRALIVNFRQIANASYYRGCDGCIACDDFDLVGFVAVFDAVDDGVIFVA